MITDSYLKNQIAMLTVKNAELTHENKELVNENEELVNEIEDFNCHVEYTLGFWDWVSFERYVEIQELKEELADCKCDLEKHINATIDVIDNELKKYKDDI